MQSSLVTPAIICAIRHFRPLVVSAARPEVRMRVLRMGTNNKPGGAHPVRSFKLFSSQNSEVEATPPVGQEHWDYIREKIADFAAEALMMIDQVPVQEKYRNDAADTRMAISDLAQSARDKGKYFDVLSGITTLLYHLRLVWTFYGDVHTQHYPTEPEELIFRLAREAAERKDANSMLNAFNLTGAQDQLVTILYYAMKIARKAIEFYGHDAMVEAMKKTNDIVEFYGDDDIMGKADRGKGDSGGNKTN